MVLSVSVQLQALLAFQCILDEWIDGWMDLLSPWKEGPSLLIFMSLFIWPPLEDNTVGGFD